MPRETKRQAGSANTSYMQKMESKRQVSQEINQLKCFLYTGNYVSGKKDPLPALPHAQKKASFSFTTITQSGKWKIS
jgi:hypothetical protein